MSDAVLRSAQLATAGYLRELLLKPGVYRDRWQQHVARPRSDFINQLAVAEVIAAHLASSSGRAALTLPQVRDMVSGALSGATLSMPVLQLFAAAFGFSEEESARLHRFAEGSASIRVMTGTRAVPQNTEQGVQAMMAGRRRHQNLSLHNHIWVAGDGRIDRAHNILVIEAIERGVDRIPFVCDANVLTIEAGQGCRGVSSQVRSVDGSFFATDILLARTLDLGETLSFEYRVSYRFPGDPADPAEREYRRAVMRQVESLDMRVEFHPDRLPAQVWFAHWDGSDGEVLEREPVTLDSQHSVQRFLRSIEKTVVGFCWSWEPE